MMVGQLARAMEIVIRKQLTIITAREPKSSGIHPANERETKIEFWVTSGRNSAVHEFEKEREFHITIEETT